MCGARPGERRETRRRAAASARRAGASCRRRRRFARSRHALGDLNQLLLRERQRADSVARRNVGLDFLQDRGRAPLGRAAVDEPEDLRARLPAEEHVFRDGELGYEAELLVDQGEPELTRAPRRLDPFRRAVDIDVAGIVGIAPREHPHEGGLAGPVFADDSVNLTAADVQIDPANRVRAKKSLADLDHADRLPSPDRRSAQVRNGGCGHFGHLLIAYRLQTGRSLSRRQRPVRNRAQIHWAVSAAEQRRARAAAAARVSIVAQDVMVRSSTQALALPRFP